MFEKTATALFFAATFSAVALAAITGAKAMQAGGEAQLAQTPVFKFETVVITGQRATKVSSLTPEQVAIVR
jgi:hypothetical protein